MEFTRKKIIPLAAIAVIGLAATTALAVNPASGSPDARHRSTPDRPRVSTHHAVPGSVITVSWHGCKTDRLDQTSAFAYVFNDRSAEYYAGGGTRIKRGDDGRWTVALHLSRHAPAGRYTIASGCDRYDSERNFPSVHILVKDASAVTLNAPNSVKKGKRATIHLRDVARPSGFGVGRHIVHLYARRYGQKRYHIVRTVRTDRHGRAALRMKITKRTSLFAQTPGSRTTFAGRSRRHVIRVGS